MKWNDPEFLEAIRLIRKFFPESKAVISNDLGLHWDVFLSAMKLADWSEDSSCDPFCRTTTPEMTLAQVGGMDGTEAEIYDRLLGLSGFSPMGRAAVVPDTLGWGESSEDRLPFVCAAAKLGERLREIDDSESPRYVFGTGSSDTLVVFESGEALLANHDERFFWAKSRLRNSSREQVVDDQSPTRRGVDA